MSKLEFLTGKDYLSHSSLTSYLDCGKRFYLERIARVPQQKSWWLVGGSAFHLASEYLDRGTIENASLAWATAWDEQYEKDITAENIDPADVKAGGRASKDWPNKENIDWWKHHGEVMTVAYKKWRDARFEEGYRFLEMPDGAPAVEVPIQLVFDGLLVKGYIDRIMVTPDGEAFVMDLKTGSHTPASTLQLGIYALGLERAVGIRPILGSYYMARKATLAEPSSLLHYTPEYVGETFLDVKDMIEAEKFVPHVTSLCGTCSVRRYCPAQGAPAPIPSANATSH